jgi:EAL domain-containing protein (putative c-di-GMP-specific phosphodiesterase class I)
MTETVIFHDTLGTIARLEAIRALGVRIAIDDFGTGYSSLGYLHAFQVDELKIDRSFVSGPAHPRDAEVLSRAIVELGHALGLDLVAEGIETADQAELFRALGCRYGQGFLYTKPLPPAELEGWLGARAATRAA